ncbi:MAG: chitobiase/beta-hexosaminidase C-terminal domain-containing protein, partial [Bacteroidota bacterium]
WSGFSDSTSGINSYKVVYSTSNAPSSCSNGTQIYSSTGTSYTHASLSSGTTYYYRICAVDNAGNTSTGATASATTQTSDTTAPTGSISINSGAANTNSVSATLTLSCTDTNGCSQMQFSNDNTNWSTAEAYATSKTWPLASGDGTKTVYEQFKDGAGNWSTVYSDTILLDSTAPTTAASPAGGTYTSAQSVTLTCSDGTGSGCDKIYYTTDGTTPTTASTVYSTAISISATKTLKFLAKDLAGNQETVGTEVYTIDTISPELVLSTLSNWAVTNNSTLNLSGTVTDNTGIQGLTVNGNAVTVNADGSFSYAMVINEEANVITTTATDSAGNQTTDTRSITLDTTAPTQTISSPADNSKTAVSVATVTGTIDENSAVTVTLNGGIPHDADIIGNTFTLDIALASGVNTIEATATDTAGNTSTQKRTVTYDDAKPSLAITDPSQDIWTNQGSVTIRGTVSDALTTVLVSVMVD